MSASDWHYIRSSDHVAEGSTDSVVEAAMSSARAAQRRWCTTSLAHRLECVRVLRSEIAQHGHALADASASNRSRPMRESLVAEVLPLAEACRYLERHAASILKPRRFGRRGRPLWLGGVTSEVHREPHGVVLIIAPGNYPLLLPGVQVIQALVAGNAVLLKPGVGGTYAARTLIELISRAGFDSHLVMLLPEAISAARGAMEARPDKVFFTGSAATGEVILQQLAPHLIPATVELSGCDAVVVRDDADQVLTAKALSFGLRWNRGATCIAPKRAFVHRSIATEIEGRLSKMFNVENAGSDSSAGLDVTFPVNADAAARLKPLVEDALAKGAHFIAGRVTDTGEVYGPVILGGVPPSARLLQEDPFAPVLSVVTVADDAEAVARANDCPYALGASVFSRDEAAARQLASLLEAGVVTINDLIVPTADARIPFGGRKRSGFGVTRGAEGLLELTVPKVVTTSRGRVRPAFDPPHPKDEALFRSYLKLRHSRGLRARVRAMVSLVASLAFRNKPTDSKS